MNCFFTLNICSVPSPEIVKINRGKSPWPSQSLQGNGERSRQIDSYNTVLKITIEGSHGAEAAQRTWHLTQTEGDGRGL